MGYRDTGRENGNYHMIIGYVYICIYIYIYIDGLGFRFWGFRLWGRRVWGIGSWVEGRGLWFQV